MCEREKEKEKERKRERERARERARERERESQRNTPENLKFRNTDNTTVWKNSIRIWTRQDDSKARIGELESRTVYFA
jgi:hypothetical protein